MKTQSTPASIRLEAIISPLNNSAIGYRITKQDEEIRSVIGSVMDHEICPEHGTLEQWANLFAAAPELLAALQLMVRADECISENIGTKADHTMIRIAALDMAQAAIAKASA
jgi:hypothetical protein